MQQISALFQRIFPRTQGNLYDLVIFAFGFILPWLLQPLGDAIRALIAGSDTAHGLLMLTAMLLQIPGALFKRKALHERVANDPDQFSQALKSDATIAWLLFLYWLLMTYVALSAVKSLTDWSAGPGMGTTFALASLVTGVVGYAAWLPGVDRSSGSRRRKDEHEQNRSKRSGGITLKWEHVADALLMFAALIVMYAIWQPFADEIMSGQGHIRREASGSIGGTIAYTIVVALPFAMFFIEDARDRGTWIRFGIIYLFAAWRMFFG